MMEPNSPEHFGWSAMCAEAGGCFPTQAAFLAGIRAYEAARPKPVTITGLPETLPDGRKIVGWRYAYHQAGEWGINCHELAEIGEPVSQFDWTHEYGPPSLIAITEPDNG